MAFLNLNGNAQPFYIVGPDGNIATLSSNKDANGTAATSNPTLVAGTDSGGIVRRLRTDTNGVLTVGGSVTATNVTGNVGNGSVDSGNSVKVGAVYTAGEPAYANSLSRLDLRTSSIGDLRVAVAHSTNAGDGGTSRLAMTASAEFASLSTAGQVYNGSTWDRQRTATAANVGDGTGLLGVGALGLDTVSNQFRILSSQLGIGDASANGANALVANARGQVFNGTTWDRTRGDTNGTYMVGNVASGAVDVGNPVKVGAEYLATAPTFTTGSRTDMQSSGNGSLYVDFARAANQTSPTGDAQTARTGLNTYGQNMYFNGSAWDRAKGNTVGAFISSCQNFVDSQTALAASATFTGTTRAPGTESRFSFFITDVYSDQPGTLYIERSVAATTWLPANGVAGQAVAAGQSTQVKLPITTANYRFRYVNGATAQTVFLATSAFSLN